MTQRRLTLRKLTVSNGTLPPATVSFQPGLNLILGASDTGKTFIFEALDFMLGAKDGLRRIPEADGYRQVELEVDPSQGSVFTLKRAFEGGAFELREYGSDRDGTPFRAVDLSPLHAPDPAGSLSAYLLHLIGIGNRQVRKNAQGEKVSLSFRHVMHLAAISETAIIKEGSPVLSEHDVSNTAEANAFAYFLTGQDDSAIIPQESARARKARFEAQASYVETLLESRRAELASHTAEGVQLDVEAARLDDALADATGSAASVNRDISQLERQRQERRNALITRQSRLRFLEEQNKRFNLLQLYYDSDQGRLRAVVEASRALDDLPHGTCPLCRQPLQGSGNVPAHCEFETACSMEIDKIEVLRRDLAKVIAEFNAEADDARSAVRALSDELRDLDGQLREVLSPRSRALQGRIQDLVEARRDIMKAQTLQAAIEDLEKRLLELQAAQGTRVKAVKFQQRATTSSATEFCRVVQALLEDWKYPDVGAVAFDTDTQDIVIAGKNRANTGKGYRAITHAAFALGLMRYCRQKAIPHPGFVILDTPVNPYKGPIGEADRVNDDVRAAFFRSLAQEKFEQIIIMENVEPPADACADITVHRFTRNASSP